MGLALWPPLRARIGHISKATDLSIVFVTASVQGMAFNFRVRTAARPRTTAKAVFQRDFCSAEKDVIRLHCKPVLEEGAV